MGDFLVCYDVNTVVEGGAVRLRRVAKVCEGFGVRVQYSVFECVLTEADIVRLVGKLSKVMDERHDSVRIYPLDGDARDHAVRLGRDGPSDIRDPLIL